MVQRKIIGLIEEFAPIETQLSYDKCGLKTGDLDKESTGVLVCLDLSPQIVSEAVKKGCNLIIEHHPTVWHAWTSIDIRYPKVKALIDATNKGISVYSAHTNIDFAKGGLNDVFADMIGLTNVQPLPEGRLGTLTERISLANYAKFVGMRLNDKNVRIIGNPEKTIKNVICINGAGGGEEELILDFAKISDVFVTGEVKYNVARLSKDIDYAIIEVGHYTSEKGFMPLIHRLISKKMPDVPVYEAETLPDPYL